MNSKPKVIICGATGNQGGAVAAAMLAEQRWNVIVLIRNPLSAASRRLEAAGASVLKADTRDLSSLVQAFTGAFGVFGVTQPWSSLKRKYDTESEIIQGKNIIWACKEAKVSNLVFSSFISYADGLTSVSFIDSKLSLENILMKAHIPYTILRTSLYMEHIDWHNDSKGTREVSGNYGAKSVIPYTALTDIGRSTAFIFSAPDKFLYRTIQVTGDVFSGDMIAETLFYLTSVPYKYRSRSKLWRWLLRPETYRLRVYPERQRQYSSHESAGMKGNNDDNLNTITGNPDIAIAYALGIFSIYKHYAGVSTALKAANQNGTACRKPGLAEILCGRRWTKSVDFLALKSTDFLYSRADSGSAPRPFIIENLLRPISSNLP